MSPRLWLKNLLFLAVIPCTMTIFVPAAILHWFPGRGGPESLLFRLPILLLGLAGAAVLLRCTWDFGAVGGGTPAPIDPPPRLVVRGLFRSMRNPMYTAVVAVLIAEALWFGAPSLLPWIAFFTLMVHLFVVRYEEPGLRRRFGRDYELYCDRVRRWLPGWPIAPLGGDAGATDE